MVGSRELLLRGKSDKDAIVAFTFFLTKCGMFTNINQFRLIIFIDKPNMKGKYPMFPVPESVNSDTLATIKINATLSEKIAIPLGKRLIALITDNALIATSLSFLVSVDGSTWVTLSNKSGEVVYPCGKRLGIVFELSDMLPWKYFQIRSGTSASPTTQTGADTVFAVVVANI